MLKTTIEYKLSWERELAQRVKEGRTGPEPIPHPDDIIIDMTTGQVHFKGPRTGEEKAVIDQLRAHKEECTGRITELKLVLRERSLSHRQRQTLLTKLDEELRMEERLTRIIPD